MFFSIFAPPPLPQWGIGSKQQHERLRAPRRKPNARRDPVAEAFCRGSDADGGLSRVLPPWGLGASDPYARRGKRK